MAIQTKHKLLIFWIILLTFVAFGAWHSEDMETAYWAMWTVPIIFLFIWLLFDCIFVDDKAFIFDHDYEVPAASIAYNCTHQQSFPLSQPASFLSAVLLSCALSFDVTFVPQVLVWYS